MTPSEGSYVGPSSCNEYTDRLGAGQRVLSYSYYTPGSITLVLLGLLFAGLDSFKINPISGLIVGKTTGNLRNRHWFRYLGLVKRLLEV